MEPMLQDQGGVPTTPNRNVSLPDMLLRAFIQSFDCLLDAFRLALRG